MEISNEDGGDPMHKLAPQRLHESPDLGTKNMDTYFKSEQIKLN